MDENHKKLNDVIGLRAEIRSQDIQNMTQECYSLHYDIWAAIRMPALVCVMRK